MPRKTPLYSSTKMSVLKDICNDKWIDMKTEGQEKKQETLREDICTTDESALLFHRNKNDVT